MPQKPTCQSGATLVEVDVVVSDGSGRPVRGLRKEDFTVAEDDTPIDIATFSAIDLPAAPMPATPAVLSQADRLGQTRMRSAMVGLTSAIRSLGTIRHRRKSLLFVSQGFPAPLEAIIRDPRIGEVWDSIREFFQTAQPQNIAIDTVDPCGLERDLACNSASRQGLRTIAENTNGFATLDTNALALTEAVARALRFAYLPLPKRPQKDSPSEVGNNLGTIAPKH